MEHPRILIKSNYSHNQPGKTTIIETIFAIKLDHQPLFEVGRRLSHNFGVCVLENMATSHFDVALTRDRTERRLRAEVNKLATEVALVLRHVLVQTAWQTGI